MNEYEISKFNYNYAFLPYNFQIPDITYNSYNVNLVWLDSNINNFENMNYQEAIKNMKKFNTYFYSQTKESISKLKTFEFTKTFILISGSISQEFFMHFEEVLDEIKICPIIIVFTSRTNLDLIKRKVIGLEKFYFFDIKLVFDNFYQVKNQLLIENIYIHNYKQQIDYDNLENCFIFEYINDLKDLILPLKYINLVEIPSKAEILEFNKFLLDKYNNKQINDLIEQLIIDKKIPLQILIKYWIRIYTLETPFHHEMNYTLIKQLNNDFEIYIKALYQGLKAKKIKSFIDDILYRGSKITLDEINYIKTSLNNKSKGIPGCICFNKSFFSTSLDKDIAISFMNKKYNLKINERNALYIIKKNDDLDGENISNIDVQQYSKFKNEKEILFLPFSCFEIIGIEEKEGFYEINLSYIGKYKNKINSSQSQVIPENNFTKNILSLNILDKIEMAKEKNQKKFEFNINKYIPPTLKKSHIKAVYNITPKDINKNIKIMNFDDEINKNEIKNNCSIYLNGKKIDFNPNYIFTKPGKYIFKFEFNDLLKNAKKLFCGCDKLISLDFSNFKSNYINDMTDMFKDCKKLEKIDLSNFKTKEVSKMKGTFSGCNSLKSLDLSSFDTDNVTDMDEMFSNCDSLSFLNLSNFKTSKVKPMNKMFEQCNPNLFINVSNSKKNKIDDINKMFYFNSKNDSFNSSELENKYKDLNLKGEKYISQNQIAKALKSYEEAYFIAEKLKDNFKINESECNKGICYFNFNKIKEAMEAFQTCYQYFYKSIIEKSNNKDGKNINFLCKSGAYLCLCNIALSHDKDECINLIKNIYEIISKKQFLACKKLYLEILNEILFNIDSLSLINNINSFNDSESESNILEGKENEINEIKKLFSKSLCKYLETNEIESWINSLEIIYQKLNKYESKIEIEKVLFHMNKAKSFNKIKNNVNDSNISNNNIDYYEYKLSIIKELYKILNNSENISKKNEGNLKLYEEISEILKKFFEEAYVHIYSGELITKINRTSNGSKAHHFRLELITGHLLYYDGSIINRPKKDFDLTKIIKLKIGIETRNIIRKYDKVNIISENKNKPYRFISFILKVDKKKEIETLDLVFNNNESARKWFYGLYYYFHKEKMPYKICSCTNYLINRFKSKIMNKLDYDMSDIKILSFTRCFIRYFKKE